MKNFFLPLSLCLTALSFAAQASDSAYTPLADQYCKMVESNAQEDYFSMSCQGRDGYEVKVSGGDSRSWLVLLKNGQPVYDSMNDVNANVKGQFPYIAGKVLEWRYDNAKALVGLIVRVNSQNADNPEKSISELFVFRHDNGRFCFSGVHKSNEGARKIADSKGFCR